MRKTILSYLTITAIAILAAFTSCDKPTDDPNNGNGNVVNTDTLVNSTWIITFSNGTIFRLNFANTTTATLTKEFYNGTSISYPGTYTKDKSTVYMTFYDGGEAQKLIGIIDGVTMTVSNEDGSDPLTFVKL